jgi:predicted metal-dependent hydrolase
VAEAIPVGDPAIAVRLRRDPRARRLVLRVARSGGSPTLTLPPGVPLASARAFLDEQEPWLRRHLASGPPRRSVGDGTLLPFGDGTLAVRVRERGRVQHADGELLVSAGRQIGAQVAAFLGEAARAACLAATERHAATLGLRPARVSLRDPKARWGSCSASGDLMYSWRLVLAPSAVLDYVVAHEVAHLAELNHSPRFWAVVRRLCPDFDAPRGWLRGNGAGLHAWDFRSAA